MAAKFDPFLIETGDRIRTFRKKRHMSQMQLAAAVSGECARNAISGYENGGKEMGIRRLKDIADALMVSPETLLRNEDEDVQGILEIYSQLDDENKAMALKQMKALLIMQKMQ